MFKPKLSLSATCFGLKWINQEEHKYEITNEREFLTNVAKQMGSAGIDGIELGTLGPWNKEEERESFPFVYEALNIIKNEGIYFNSAHLPFSCWWRNVSSLDEEIRKLAVESTKWSIGFFDGVMPNLFVVHPDEPPKTPEERPAKLEQLIKSMREICDFSPVPVCIENMVGSGLLNDPKEAKILLDAVPNLYMTVDVNHSLIVKPEEYIKAIGNRVKNVHISDNDGTWERHWLPGEGAINFNAVLNELEKTGYTGMLTYEVDVKKDYTPLQVKENYDKLILNYNK